MSNKDRSGGRQAGSTQQKKKSGSYWRVYRINTRTVYTIPHLTLLKEGIKVPIKGNTFSVFNDIGQ